MPGASKWHCNATETDCVVFEKLTYIIANDNVELVI